MRYAELSLQPRLYYRSLQNSSGVQGTGHTRQYPQDFEIRGDVQFIEQRGVGSKLLGSFNTQLYGARLTASYADAFDLNRAPIQRTNPIGL